MAGTRKRLGEPCVSSARKSLKFDEMEPPGNGKQTRKGGVKGRKGKTNSPPKTKQSPRKAGKGKKEKGERKQGTVRVAFEEDNNEVILEVDGLDSEFLEDPPSQNNNATLASDEGPKKVSRADKFRNMVSSASSALDMDNIDQHEQESTPGKVGKNLN